MKHHPNGNLKNIMAFFFEILFVEAKKVLLNIMLTEKKKSNADRFTFNTLYIYLYNFTKLVLSYDIFRRN